MAKIGVVTVTYNSAKVLPDFISSILSQSYTNWFLYVVDNASKDETRQILETQLKMKLISNEENYGVAKGNNQGIECAMLDKCDYILLLNNDTVFDANLFSQLLNDLIDNNADMISPKIMYFEPKNVIWCAGGEFKFNHALAAVHYGKDEIDEGQYNKPFQCSYVPTCCVLIKSQLFVEVGMMDEKYFVYSDDVDWMLRAYRKLTKLFYTPNAKLYHKVSSLTGGEDSPFSLFYGTRNRVYCIRKNIPNLGLKYLYLFEYFCWICFNFLRLKTDFKSFKIKLKSYFIGLFY